MPNNHRTTLKDPHCKAVYNINRFLTQLFVPQQQNPFHSDIFYIDDLPLMINRFLIHIPNDPFSDKMKVTADILLRANYLPQLQILCSSLTLLGKRVSSLVVPAAVLERQGGASVGFQNQVKSSSES